MGLLQLTAQLQAQAASAGIFVYPGVSGGHKDFKIGDEFTRDALTPTDGYELYTTAGTGTEVITLPNDAALRLTTGGTSGNDANVRTSGLVFRRASHFIDDRNQLELNISLTPTGSTQHEIFVGLLNSFAAITAIPTTAFHAGVFVDAGASATNYFLTSADGTTQSTTDTGVNAATFTHRLQIIWRGQADATLNFYDTDFTTILATQTITANLTTNAEDSLSLHFFIETTDNSTAGLDIQEWLADYS